MGIYDSIGGGPAVRAAVDDFYARVLADPQLAPFFTGVDLQHLKAHQRAFIAAAIGGAEIYQGRDMAAAHAGLAITDADFDAVAGHLVDTLTGLGCRRRRSADRRRARPAARGHRDRPGGRARQLSSPFSGWRVRDGGHAGADSENILPAASGAGEQAGQGSHGHQVVQERGEAA